MFAALVTTAFVLVILALVVLRSRHHKRYPVTAELINSSGIVDQSLTPQGAVIVRGELWLARSLDGSHIEAKTKVTVVGIDNHIILVS
jgi:membrane-bound serine protease (ClpP class)